MGSVPWVFLTVFLAVPILAIVADLAWLTGDLWTVPWLALVAMVWFGFGMVVAIGAVPTEPVN